MARELSELQRSATAPVAPEEQFGLPDQVRRGRAPDQVADKPASLQKLVATVEKVSQNAEGQAVMQLANGQVWEQTAQVTGFYVNPGESVTITPGALKSFWVRVDSRPPARVRRQR
jgi:hypothetical protein